MTGPAEASDAVDRYLTLLEQVLTRSLVPDRYAPVGTKGTLKHVVGSVLARRRLSLVREVGYDPAARREGRDRPAGAETMVGLLRLQNVRHCIEEVLRDDVPGDLLEAGVWRGGTAIYMRAVLAAHGDAQRKVWLADSFRGLPKPDASKYPADAGDPHWTFEELAVSVDTVKENFRRYGLLDDRVEFLQGWFSETLSQAPVDRIAVLRLDGDMYASTMDTLEPLYPKVPPGGFVIVDDYGAVPACKQAVDDYRSAHGITEPIERIDWTGAYWRRQS